MNCVKKIVYGFAALLIAAPLFAGCAPLDDELGDSADAEDYSDLEDQVTSAGNLRVKVGSAWVSVACKGNGTTPIADGTKDTWRILSDRRLINQKNLYLYCGEGWANGRNCQCSSSSSEAYHAITKADFNVDASDRKHENSLSTNLAAKGTMYIFPNNAHEFCLAVGPNKSIQNKDGGDDGNHHESTHKGKCNEWCFGSASCP
jgi:hypothetical protein